MNVSRGSIRPSPLAGRWYPGDARALAAEVAGHLAHGAGRAAAAGTALARVAVIVSPHAGLVYSGPTAGVAWAAAPSEGVRRLVIVGPAHRVPFRGVALGDFRAFRIPTGDVPVDREALAALERDHPRLASFVPGAHDQEHCLEIQLPFAQARHPGVPIVPLLVGAITTEDLATLLEATLRPDDLLVVSTDLSHFHPYDDGRARDLATLDAIASLLAERTDRLGGEDACGHRGVSAAALLARRRGYRAVLLDCTSSGDTGGDHDAVVGYGALALGPAGGA